MTTGRSIQARLARIDRRAAHAAEVAANAALNAKAAALHLFDRPERLVAETVRFVDRLDIRRVLDGLGRNYTFCIHLAEYIDHDDYLAWADVNYGERFWTQTGAEKAARGKAEALGAEFTMAIPEVIDLRVVRQEVAV